MGSTPTQSFTNKRDLSESFYTAADNEGVEPWPSCWQHVIQPAILHCPNLRFWRDSNPLFGINLLATVTGWYTSHYAPEPLFVSREWIEHSYSLCKSDILNHWTNRTLCLWMDSNHRLITCKAITLNPWVTKTIFKLPLLESNQVHFG